MKILMVSQYYFPEPFRHPDICEALVKRGHEVTALVGTPNYPMGTIYPEYRGGRKKDEVLNGVKVHRCFTIGRRNNIVFRFLNYYSYCIAASLYALRMKEEYDVVFVNQLSPVMMAYPGMIYRKRRSAGILLYCLDLWPESLMAGSMTRDSLIYRYYRGVSARIYRGVDRILATSRSFGEYFRTNFGLNEIGYLPQYAEAIFTPEQCAKKPDGTIDLMLAGNIGKAQSVDTILRAAELTRDIPQLRWHIVGDGSELPRLRDAAAGLPNLIFHGRKPLEEMPKYYAMADAMLITLGADPVLSLTLPGKMQTYMAAGKAVLGAIDGETPEVIRSSGCGLCGPAEDAEALAENARRLMQMDLSALGCNARAYYDKYFEKERFLDDLENALQSLVQSSEKTESGE